MAGQARATVPARLPSGKPWPKISIITPTLNRGHMLEAAMLSVLEQGYPNLEYIVMDGGSTDNSVEIIKRHESRLQHWESKKDKGQSDALNKGFSRATGELLTWLNSDDQFEPDALFAAALAYDQSQADLFVGLIRMVHEWTPGGLHLASCAEDQLRLADLLDVETSWTAGKFFFQSEVVFTREIWEKAGGHVREDLHFSMDYDLWCRMALADARVKIIGKPLCSFLIHANQKTLGNPQSKFRQELHQHARRLISQHGVQPRRRRIGSQLPRVCLISDHGIKFGAGKANHRLAMALATAGHAVTVLELDASLDVRGKQVRHPKISEVIDRLHEFRADIVMFGNIHAVGMPPAIVTEVCKKFPTFVIAHDLWWLLGKDIYPPEPERVTFTIGKERKIWAKYPRTLPGKIEELRREKIEVVSSPFAPVFLAASTWAQRIHESGLAKMGYAGEVMQISIPVSPDFRPYGKAQSRELLGLPDDKIIILTSSTELEEERKQFWLLVEALQKLDTGKILLLVMGRKPPFDLDLGFDCQSPGTIDDDTRLSRYYSAADLVVSASAIETLGQTMLEAAACGTPSVAFGGSGTEIAVTHGVTGLVVKSHTPEALAKAIAKALEPAVHGEFSFWCRKQIDNEFSLYKSYYTLYQAFEAAGLFEGGNYKRSIGFATSEVTDIPVSSFKHRMVMYDLEGISGICPPYPQLQLGEYRIISGLAAAFKVNAGPASDGRRVVFCLRNYHPGQIVRILLNDILQVEAKLSHDYAVPQLLQFDAILPPGECRFRLLASHCDDRQSLLLEDFLVV